MAEGGLLRFKVPQNIDIQDRIIGPLTMLQFVYAVIGFGLCYGIFNGVPRPYNFFLMAPVAIFVLCIDFVKINERPFLNFFMAAIAYFGGPKQRYWHQGDDSDLQIEIYQVEKKQDEHKHKDISRETIMRAVKEVDDPAQNLISR